MIQRFRITCLSCKASRIVAIVQAKSDRPIIDWIDQNPNPQTAKIVSGRHRLDGNWGWQCICSNNDILTDQENSFISDKANPDPGDINRVLENLEVQTPKFEMAEV